MAVDHKQLTRIKGVSEVRRLPRLGKIRLGIKVKKAAADSRCKHRPGETMCRYCSYPKDVPHFVCPPEVESLYGKTPTALEVMIPVEDETFFFPQSYKAYTGSHLKCKGNGEVALRRAGDLTPQQRTDMGENAPKDQNALVEIPCPCPLLDSGECSQRANLMVLLPRVSMGGVYQIDSGSFHNIVRINSAIEYNRSLLGRIAMVPLLLRRIPTQVEYEGKRSTHYLLSLEFPGNITAINHLRQNTQLVMDRVSMLALPAPDLPAALPPPVPAEEDDEPPFASEPVATVPPAPPVDPNHKAVDVEVADVKQDGSNFQITTPAKIVYFTEKRDIAVAAWTAMKAKKPLRAFVGTEDGVLFIVGVEK